MLILLSFSVLSVGEVLKVGVYDNPPKIFINEKGEISGFFADLVNAIALKEGWTIEYVYGTWEEGLQRVEMGEIDVMVDVAFSEERAKLFAFNQETVFINWAAVYSREGFEVNSLLDLAGKKVAVMKDSIHTVGPKGIMNMAQEFGIELKPVVVEDYTSTFELLDTGEVDAAVVNRIFGETFSRNYHAQSTPIIFNPSKLNFAFPYNSSLTPFLIERIDTDLREMKAEQNSAYYLAMKKHLTGYVGTIEKIPSWAYVLFASLIIIIIIISVFALVYRKQKKTIKRAGAIIEKERNKLQKSNKLKDLFIDITRHDLLSPSTVVKSSVQSVLMKESDPQKKISLRLAYNANDNLINRIKDASLISRLEEGTQKIEFIWLDLMGIIEGVLKETEKLAKDKKIKVISRIKRKYFVRASPLIHDVFFNIVTNAIKYSPERTEVVVDIISKRDDYQITIADQGIGVPDKYKKAIFERLKKMEKGVIKGTGLGLVITKKLVELHKGKVWVKDNKNRGSIFVVELPR